MAARRAAAYAGAMKSNYRGFTLAILAAAFVALATTGCQTSKGFGKDVEKLGEKIQDKSK